MANATGSPSSPLLLRYAVDGAVDSTDYWYDENQSLNVMRDGDAVVVFAQSKNSTVFMKTKAVQED